MPALAQTTPDWLEAHIIGSGYPSMTTYAVDALGNTYMAGGFADSLAVGGRVFYSKGGVDGYVAKYTFDGTLVWCHQLGSAGSEQVNGIALDADGNVYVTGVFRSSVSLGNNLSLNGSGDAKLFVIRYSRQGTPLWAQQSRADAPNASTWTASGSITTDATGHVYVAGSFNNTLTIGSGSIASPPGTTGTYLARLSTASGALQSLARAFYYAVPAPNAGLNYFMPLLAITTSGEVYVLNSFTLDVVLGPTTFTRRGTIDGLVAKFNAQGRLDWVQQISGPGENWISGCAVDASGNLYATLAFTDAITLGSTTLPKVGQYDGALVKYSPSGELLWARSGGGPGFDRYNGVGLDQAGNPYVVGHFDRTAQFGGHALASAGSFDAMVVAYTPGGQVRWTQQAGGSDADLGNMLGFDSRGDIYTMGSFFRSAEFGAIRMRTTNYNHFDNSLFVARLGNAALMPQPDGGLYPNPATELVNVLDVSPGSRVQLVDVSGRIVREAITNAIGQLAVEGLTPGIYILRAPDRQAQPYAARLVVK